ncbi:MAG: protein translocase subunit SecF, partial [Desulfatibacillaceae bacterium]|nr:protein translocase subunit SecF [Desulfatibacillaceae bacterium]
LMVVTSLYLLGGEILQNFALALLVGILVGTYSSIYVASPVLLIWQKKMRSGPAAQTR